MSAVPATQTERSLAAQAPVEQLPAVRDEPSAMVAGSEPASLMAVIARAAADPSVDVEKMERLMAMYERMEAKKAKTSYAEAKVRLTAKLPRIKKRGQATGKNDVKTFKYAEWEDIDEIIRPLIVSEGFDLSFRTGEKGGQTTVTAVLLHTGGHEEETTITLPADKTGCKNDVQAVGSTVSYGKKYTAGPLLNLVYEDEDDDGNAAGGGFVTPDQAQTISDLLDRTGGDPEKFCEKVMKVDCIAHIKASDYRKAITTINEADQIRRAKAKAATK